MTGSNYQVNDAWRRALVYFGACFVIGAVSGVWTAVASTPLFTSSNLRDPVWITFTLFCFALEYVAYFVIWPRGTRAYGRPRHLPTQLSFGLLWGVSEGQLLLALYLLVERWVSSPGLIVLFSFLLMATFQGLWHTFYWDIKVAPEHNIPEWNMRKVIFAHVPNLLVTLTYLAVYGNVSMFILFQTVSLLGSTYHMRFPRPEHKWVGVTD